MVIIPETFIMVLLTDTICFLKMYNSAYCTSMSLNIDFSHYHVYVLDYTDEWEDCALHLSSCKDKNNKGL